MKQIFTFLLVFCSCVALAQHDHAGTHATSHAQHIQESRKETVYLHNLPRPGLMSGVGTSGLKITTKSDSAQKFFSQGVALVHCFWDFEGYRSFKEATRLDSTAIMPWWGVLSTTLFMKDEAFQKDKELAVKKLKALKSSATEHEKLYVEGILLADSLKETGYKEYLKKLEIIIHKYPEDIEAQLFLVVNNMSGYDLEGHPNEGQIYAEFIASNLLKTHPDNAAAHHYWIHLMENCCPEKAIHSSERLAELAPASGHMVHMPGHIYNRVGDYKKAYDAFTASVKVDSAYMKTNGIQEVDTWNYIHNIHYLLANCAQDGRYSTALTYAEKLARMPVDKSRKKVFEGNFFGQGIMAPVNMELAFGYYEKAAKRLSLITDPDSAFGQGNMAYKEALNLFALGMNESVKNQTEAARRYADALDAYLWRNGNQEKPGKAIPKFGVNILNIASLELQGLIKSLENKYDEAVTLLEAAKKKEGDLGYGEPPYYPKPILVSLGNVHLKAGKYDKAIAAYEELLKRFPNGAPALWGLYKVYKQKGDAVKTKEYADRLKKTAQYGDKGIYPL
jgi:tetratricopeptide (TPR) repeat protein